MPVKLAALIAVALTTLVSTACSGSDGDVLTIYSGRNENLVRPLLEQFAEDTGVDIEVRYGDTAELAATLIEEGDASPAEVFFSQDAGALAALGSRGLLDELPADLLDQVPTRFRDPDGRWLGVTGRARVIAYDTETLSPDEVPDSVFELTEPRWRGRVGFPPTNASFVAFVSAMIEQHGLERTRGWLEAMVANGARTYDNNVVTLEAVADGEIDLGLVNHYYLYNELEQRPGSTVANHYPGQGPDGEGTFVNVAGVGLLAGAGDDDDARRFAQYLLGERAQRYFEQETAEYPLRTGARARSELPPLDELRTVDVPLSDLGRDLEASLELLKEVGLT